MAELLRGRYEPRAELGRGAQGRVLLAFDHQHGRDVALKVRPVLSESDREALLGEARALLSLRPHPSIPLIRDDFFAGDDYVLVMDFIAGDNLAAVLSSRGDPGLAPSVALGYLAQIADALDHLHRHDPPVVHGDVKPANAILRNNGEVVLVDFGIVGIAAPTGTAGYLAPEVASGAARTPAADVYGLASTAVTLLTGAPPTGGRPTWDGVDPNFVGALERGVRRGLAIEPTRRPGSAGELVERLRGALAGSLPTGVVTFCLTDIEGSTPLWEAHPVAMGAVIARAETIVADTVESHGGRLIKSRGEGDSTLSVFGRASDAAAAALAIQLAIVDEEWPEPIDLRLRVALHTGEAELREGDYYGPTLNRAARLRGIAAAGQVLCSRATADLVADSLPPDATLAELGDRELKGLSRSELVYALEHPRLKSHSTVVGVASVEDAARRPRHNLPASLTSFVGRGEQIDELVQMLSTDRLVSLTAAGGSGKTRLALEVGRRLADKFADGVWFVDLAGSAGGDVVVLQTAAALGVTANGEPTVESLAEFVRPRSLLLILDNCEHLRAQCAALAVALTAAGSETRLLATSREPLGVPGERVWVVPALGGGEDGEAAELFFRRGELAAPGLLAESDRTAVAGICERLDGLPLAIELAAARCRMLGVDQISARLTDRFRLLGGGGPHDLGRQQTLRATVDWSHDLLDEAERALLRRMSVFSGGCTLDAVEEVCAGDPIDVDDVLEVLGRLVDKSMVVVDAARGQHRYRMLETIREYAAEKLAHSGENDTRRGAHAGWIAELAAGSEEGMTGSDDLRWLSRFDDEIDNVHSALSWATQHDPEIAVRLSGDLWVYWWTRGRMTEGRSRLAASLRAAEGVSVSAVARARAHAAISFMGYCQGDAPTVLEHAQQAISIATSAGGGPAFAWSTGWAHIDLGEISQQRGDLADTRHHFETALRVAEAGEHAYTIGRAYQQLAYLSEAQGDTEQALALARLGLAQMRSRANRVGISRLLYSVARICWGTGDYDGARAAYEESLALSEQVGDELGIRGAYEGLGTLAYEQGDHAAGKAAFEQVVAVTHRMGQPPLFQARQLLNLGRSAAVNGDPEAASIWLAAGFEIAQRAGDDALSDEFRRAIDHAASGSPREPHSDPQRLAPSAVVAAMANSVFVGRDVELGRIDEALRRAQAGAIRAVFIAGEPGVGKTQLALHAALAASADGATVLFGRCDEENVVPYQPFVEALDHYAAVCPQAELAAHAGDGASELARLVPAVGRISGPSPPIADEPDRARLFAAVTSLLTRAAAARPVVLVLDDLQWADPSTLLLVRHLLHAPSCALALVVTFRDTDLVPGTAFTNLLADLRREPAIDRISLSGLEADRVAELLRAMTGPELGRRGERLAHQLWQDTEGNPFFVGEFLRHLIETGRVFQQNGLWSFDVAVATLRVPEGIREVIGRRLGRLTDATNTTLRAAAVLGREFDFRVLEAMSDGEAALNAIEAAVDAKLVVEIPDAVVSRFEFTHALVRKTLLDGLTPPRRQRLHLRAAEAIIATAGSHPPAAAVAAHYRAAGESAEAHDAIDWSIRAAKEAAALFAWEDGVAHLEAALAIAGDGRADPADRARVIERLGNLLDSSGLDHARGIDLQEDALALYDQMGRPDRAAVVHSRLGLNLSSAPASMDIPRALEHFRAATAVLVAGPDRLSYGFLCVGMAAAALWGARIDEGMDAAGEAMAIGEELGDRGLWAFGAAMQSWALLGGGRFDEGITQLDAAWEAGHEAGNASALYVSSWVAANFFDYIGDPLAGLERAERGLAHPALANAPRQRIQLGEAAAVLLLEAGRVDECLAREAVALEHQQLGLDALVAALVTGDAARGIELGTRAAEAAERRGNIWNASWLRWCAGRAARRCGANDEAEAHFTRATTLAQAGGLRLYEGPVLAELASLLAEEGRVEQARAHLAKAQRITGDGRDWRGRASDVAAAAAAIEAATGAPAAAVSFARAIEGYRTWALPWREAEALRAWGRILTRRGDATGGESKLRAADEVESRLRAG